MTLYPKLIMDALATVTYAGHYSERFGEWRPTEVLSHNVAKEVSVKVYARDYSDATDSFMMSEKNIERHDNVRKEPFMMSGKGVKHHDNIMITSGKHQESIRIRLTKNQDFILLALHRDPNLTIPELAEIVGIAGRNIAENLKKLQELGLLERVGSRKGGKWIVRN
jgi:predicted HTH transcriptional regulator